MLAAGCNKAQPQTASQPVSQSVGQQAATATPTQAKVGQTTTGDNPNGAGYETVHPVPKMPLVTSVTVTQVVDGSSSNKASDVITAGETAFDLLKADHQITAKDYGSGMGELVESIDGITPDSKHFWEFYVNGKSSNVGASLYILKGGDKIEWKLSAISSSGE